MIRATTIERQHVGRCHLRSIELADLPFPEGVIIICTINPPSLLPHGSRCRRKAGFKEIPRLAFTGALLLQRRLA
jgi:hypothetical protein